MKDVIKKQLGFREGHSTDHAIIQLIDQIKNSFAKKSFYSCCLYWPFKSIQHCHDHHILIQKLNQYGVKRKICSFKSNLHNCK